MNWTYFSVKCDAGIEEGLPCSVCGDLDDDILYCPKNFTEEQDSWINKIWHKDPYTEFMVCEMCMEGHCGAVAGLNADNWLENQIKVFLATEKSVLQQGSEP